VAGIVSLINCSFVLMLWLLGQTGEAGTTALQLAVDNRAESSEENQVIY
jgi:hypothetical protein